MDLDRDRLALVFLDHLAPELRSTAATPSLALDLERLIARARREAPTVSLDPLQFTAYVAERVSFDHDGRAVLGTVHAGALWIACGCVLGDHAALAAFEVAYAPEIATTLSRAFEPGLAQDAELHLRERLFLVEPGKRARISSYAGRGDLRHWLRAAAVRAATDVMRARRTVAVEAETLDERAINPALGALKARYREAFRGAFATACAALTDRDRTLLRYRFIDGLSIDELAPLYRAHRATVARWLSTIREGLFEATRAALMAELDLDEHDVSGINELIDSQLDASVSRVLGPR